MDSEKLSINQKKRLVESSLRSSDPMLKKAGKKAVMQSIIGSAAGFLSVATGTAEYFQAMSNYQTYHTMDYRSLGEGITTLTIGLLAAILTKNAVDSSVSEIESLNERPVSALDSALKSFIELSDDHPDS